MNYKNQFVYPDIPSELKDDLFNENNVFTIVGVLGKSFLPHCNKMEAFEVVPEAISLSKTSDSKDCYNGRIIFYVDRSEKIIYLHFETTFDNFIMQKIVEELSEKEVDFFQINTIIRSKFAHIFLFAIHICHIIVLVDPGNSFDASYLPLFKSMNTIRDKFLINLLSKTVKELDIVDELSKEFRLCSPRIIFFFEKCLNLDKESDLEKHEIEMENEIFALLKHDNILLRNCSLFSIPKKMPFVHINRNNEVNDDPVQSSIDYLTNFLNNFSRGVREGSDVDDALRPSLGFGKSLTMYDKATLDKEFSDLKRKENSNKNTISGLVRKHVKDAISFATDDGSSRFKNKIHYGTPNLKSWLEIFDIYYKILEINPDLKNTSDQLSLADTFERLIDIDVSFFQECCDEGLKVAINRYEMNLRSHYSQSYHEQKLNQSYGVYFEYARGGKTLQNGQKLKEICDGIWMNNRQLCECLSLRGNPCIMPKHSLLNPMEHSSGVVFVSTCNCGRTQNRREDPYIVKQANYDFYQLINCQNCMKAEKFKFPVFEPSINDFCAANISLSPEKIKYDDTENRNDLSATPLTQQSHSNLSYEEFIDEDKQKEKKRRQRLETEEELNEIVVKVGELELDPDKINEASISESLLRQASTTEYLPGMATTNSSQGLLPQFPSWSLMCIGKSLLYSHNTGLLDHFQNKFLPGANFLLPWNVHVRLEHASNWTANYERCKNRKKQISSNPNVFQLKIFIGFEYECPRGHRFIMSGPEKILQSNDLTASKNIGSKVAYNDMPLYFPCRCQNNLVAQLMRIHVVTPKAPVNVKLDPKVRIGNRTSNPLIFVTGLSEPVKLTQSDYWIMRLPYVYQTEEGPILPPQEVEPDNAIIHGCLLAGMFGITESEENFD